MSMKASRFRALTPVSAGNTLNVFAEAFVTINTAEASTTAITGFHIARLANSNIAIATTDTSDDAYPVTLTRFKVSGAGRRVPVAMTVQEVGSDGTADTGGNHVRVSCPEGIVMGDLLEVDVDFEVVSCSLAAPEVLNLKARLPVAHWIASAHLGNVPLVSRGASAYVLIPTGTLTSGSTSLVYRIGEENLGTSGQTNALQVSISDPGHATGIPL